MSKSFPGRNATTVPEVYEALFNRDYTGGTLLVTEPHSTQRTNGGRAISSPVFGGRNALKRNAMRFAAAVLVGLASLVAGPNWALAAGTQHHDQVPAFYWLKVGDLEVTALLDGPAVLDLHWLTGEKATLDGVVKALHEDPHMLDAADTCFLVNTGRQLILIDAGSGTWFGGGACGHSVGNLRSAGYTPEEVDLVLVTHLHSDHVGASRLATEIASFQMPMSTSPPLHCRNGPQG